MTETCVMTAVYWQ